MSESAVADPEVQIPAESEVSTPAQQVTPESPPVTSETPDAAAPETPSPEASTEPRTPDSYDLGELNGLYDQGKLSTPELVARHKELNRAEQNRQVAEQQHRTQLQQAEQQRLQQLQSAKDNLLSEMAANREAEFKRAADRGEAPDMGLVEERNRSSIERYHGQTAEIHVEPIRAGLRQMLLHPDIWGDTAHNREAFAQMDLGGLVNSLYQRAYQKGQEDGKKTGPAADELKKAVADARKAAQDELKAANPEMITGTGSNTRNGSGSKLYSQMTTEEREALSPADRDRLVAEQYSRG